MVFYRPAFNDPSSTLAHLAQWLAFPFLWSVQDAGKPKMGNGKQTKEGGQTENGEEVSSWLEKTGTRFIKTFWIVVEW